jgi:hypothetical protein
MKYHLDDAKIEVVPQTLDNTMVLCGAHSHVTAEPEGKLTVQMVKPKMNTKKTRLEKTTQHLYDLESGNEPEKVLNIDLDLYQMENY